VTGYDCNFLVVGSGFGGAVSALRLVEKGYRVAVLEQGRRIGPEEVAAGRGRLREFVWQPEVGMHGFFWQRFFRHVGIIGGCGVGGGSLVFGGVLLEPDPGVYRDCGWAGLGVDWRAEPGPHYETAKRMLGRAVNPSLTEMDGYLRANGPLIDGQPPAARACRTIAAMLAHPARTLEVWGARSFAKLASVLVAMQPLDNELAFR
jgi:cholesterol oxidase